MQDSFPTQIRTLRVRARLTQAELARKSEVSRRTIIRWESGAASPWIPELQKVLDALETPDQERSGLLSQIKTLRAAQANLSSAHHPTYRLAVFLRAMRRRAGLTSRQLAEQLGVHASSIVRWEGGELLPSADTVERLFDRLEVHPLEREAFRHLMEARSCLRPTPADLAGELREITFEGDEWTYAVFDLRFTELIDRLETMAVPETLSLRMEAHSVYAEMLARCHRHADAHGHARQVLRCVDEGSILPKSTYHRAKLVAAKCHFYGGWRSAQRGLALLDGLETAALTSELLSWRLSLYAEGYFLHGREELALCYGRSALAVAKSIPNALRTRKTELAHHLLRLGRAEEALATMPQIGDSTPANTAGECRLLGDILQTMGREDEARHWRGMAENLIRRYHLQPLFEGEHA